MYKVKNGNEFDFEARYDGKDYFFPKGETVVVPVDAAIHIFGIGETNKTAIYARHGWALPGQHTLADGKRILDNFAFEAIDFALPAPLAERGPAPALQDADDAEEVADAAASSSSVVRGKQGAKPKGVHQRFVAAA